MNIKNSPPFILDILPDTFQQLKLIVTNYEDRMSQLASIEFFVCFIDNLMNKLKKCIRVLFLPANCRDMAAVYDTGYTRYCMR